MFKLIIQVCTLLSPTALKGFVELYQIHFPAVESQRGVSWTNNLFVTGEEKTHYHWTGYMDRIKNYISDFSQFND